MVATSKKPRSPKPKSCPTLEHELKAGHPGALIAGVDEVGRGPLAGPVVAAAVILPYEVDFNVHPWLKSVHDSKLVPEEKRLELAPLIERWAVASAVGVASIEEIDRLNIYHASHLAMCRAIEKLGKTVDHVLVDGNVVPKALKCAATAIVKGDQKCLSIAAASILAKVWRDRHMDELEAQYPGYGFARHKGYPTPMHLEALQKLGYCQAHRRSFAPVQQQLQLELLC